MKEKRVIDNPLPMCLLLSQGHGWMASIKKEGGLLTPSAPLWEDEGFVLLGEWKNEIKMSVLWVRKILLFSFALKREGISS